MYLKEKHKVGYNGKLFLFTYYILIVGIFFIVQYLLF